MCSTHVQKTTENFVKKAAELVQQQSDLVKVCVDSYPSLLVGLKNLTCMNTDSIYICIVVQTIETRKRHISQI